MEVETIGQYNLVFNAFSFTVAAMGATTLFLWISRGQVAAHYRPAITISGLVTFIALYHYLRIGESWVGAYEVDVIAGTIQPAADKAFNQAYRYVDWLLTVPLLLIELILIMRLSRQETVSKATKLGIAAALMVILGYPGEISADAGTRWLWWVLAMIPFIYIVYELFVGLREAIEKQPEQVRGLVSAARWVTIGAWCFYPVVFIFPMIGLTGGAATTAVEVGYTIADVVAKAVLGIMIYMIAVKKTEIEGGKDAAPANAVAAE